MFARTAYALVIVLFTSLVAHADEARDSVSVAGATIATDAAVTPPAIWRPTTNPSRLTRPAALPVLYAGLGVLQVFDGYSTTRALAGGATEANPVMKHVVDKPAVFWSMKAAMAVAPALAAERMWKTNKVGAIAVMAISNGMMAAVAAHNAKVLNHVR